MYLDNGFRSQCCYAPIKMGRKKVKNTNLTINIWICCKCNKRDVNIVKYNKNEAPRSTFAELDTGEDDVLE